jgi:excisionase family DNA binding protein
MIGLSRFKPDETESVLIWYDGNGLRFRAKTSEARRMDDRWLSVDEIALYLGIKRDTVYKWIDDKRMPAHKVGRLWKFRREEIDDWVRAGGAANKEEAKDRTHE